MFFWLVQPVNSSILLIGRRLLHVPAFASAAMGWRGCRGTDWKREAGEGRREGTRALGALARRGKLRRLAAN